MVFSNELALHIRWPKDWTFSFSTSPSNEYSELIIFRIDWFDLLKLQVTLKGFLQPTTIRKHQFFGTQPWSNSQIHTWLLQKTTALTIWIFVGKVMSPLFNMLSRFFVAFLSRSKSLLISWLQSPSAVSIWSSRKEWYGKALGEDVKNDWNNALRYCMKNKL